MNTATARISLFILALHYFLKHNWHSIDVEVAIEMHLSMVASAKDVL